MTLLEIIEQARENVGGSANALARKLKLSPPTVLYWTWDVTLPLPDKLDALAAVAELDPDVVRHAWLEAQMARHARRANGASKPPPPTTKRSRKPRRPIRGGSANAAAPPVVEDAADQSQQAPSYRTLRRAA